MTTAADRTGKQLKHGHCPSNGKMRSPEYHVWNGMIQRCTNPKHKSFHNYGGRGITVDPAWRDFRQFYLDMGDRPVGTTLDRKDVNGAYCKDNCMWSPASIQNRNRRRHAPARLPDGKFSTG